MKSSPRRSLLHFTKAHFAVVLTTLLLAACEPPVKRPTGWAQVYQDAKEMFGRARFDRALEFTDGLASATPPNAYTEKGRVLRIIIMSGQVRGYKELADAYAKGVESTMNPRIKSDDERWRHDYRQYAAQLALGLGEVAHKLTEAGTLSKELTLDAPYPSAEGPVVIAQLNRVIEGGAIESDDQEAATRLALRKGIDDTLAELVGGDRSKARTALSAGPVKIDGVDFALFLGKQLLIGASIFDLRHVRDPKKLEILLTEVDRVAKAALALLKDKPDKEKEKEVKKLQSQIKAAAKNI